jgi:hypothetical protein
MFELKRISHEAIPGALAKAERYRLLNEPEEAESICLDILEIDHDNQQAVITLLLALSDQLHGDSADCFFQAEALLPRVQGDYERCYYHGLLWERRAYARLHQGGPGSYQIAYHWIRQAMDWYEHAAKQRPAGNDDALLRWNTCVRHIHRYHLEPEPEREFVPSLEDY